MKIKEKNNEIRHNSPNWETIYGNRKKILLVATYPPPIGGVSIHVKRLANLLKEKKYAVSIVDLSKKFWLPGFKWLYIFFQLLINSYDILHLHRVDKKILTLIWTIRKFKSFELFISIHNDRLFSKESGLQLEQIRNLFVNTKQLIVVGSHIASDIQQNLPNLSTKIIVKNSFIPPIMSEELTLRQKLPTELLNFIQQKSPVINSSAFKLKFFENIDLYGLDMCVELTNRLKSAYPNIGFVFAIAAPDEQLAYQLEIAAKIKQYQLEENFFFLKGQYTIWPIFGLCDMTVRPTYKDGFGITIAESIAMNCPVVASNVCERAVGTVLFDNRNLDDFVDKCTKILKKNKDERR